MKILDKRRYQFADELKNTVDQKYSTWKILIADPDDNIHKVTRLAFKNFVFDEKGVVFFDTQSNEDVKEIIEKNPDIAVLILNISKKGPETSLNLIRYIREELKNNIIRVVVHNSANYILDMQFIWRYDIFEYREINSETKENYFSILLSALRYYRDLLQIEKNKKDIQKISVAANRFIPQPFLKILKKDSLVEMNLNDCAEVNKSVLFLDIRSFTSLSEFLTPIETFKFINNCMSYLEPYIRKNKGFIDKYIGDSILALFSEKSDDAVKAGIQMLESLESYNFDRIKKRQLPINIGIGINTGMVIIGIVGFHDRMECTVISDAVNVASRIEKLNKFLNTHLLINEKTFVNLSDPEQFHIRSLGKQQLYGKMQFHTVYEIYDNNPEHIKNLKEKTLNEFSEAILAYQSGDYEQAHAIFKKIVEINRHDSVSKYYLGKTAELLKKSS